MAQAIPTIQQVIDEAQRVFRQEFNEEPEIAVFAPGRVNLIGEHTDYNDGYVLPMALPLVTVMVGKAIAGEETILFTTNKDADEPKKTVIEMPNRNALVRTLTPCPPKWANYVRGVIANFAEGYPSSFKAVVHSSVPTGGGLSSSAALEVCTYTFLEQITEQRTQSAPKDKALACQKAEHDYAGMPCGIMDQFISVMGKKDNALLIDCRTMGSTLIPLADPNIVVLITNSNVKHELTGSEYASRRQQCQEAAMILKKISLRDATIEDIDYLISINTNSDVVKRARHVVTEIQRTSEAAQLLKEKNFTKVGEYMTASHKSLRDDFEVSCPEVDSLVELALEVDGVLGSRMTGGGFGGCTVTLVYASAVNNVIENIQNQYKGTATFYICKPSEGTSVACICKH